MSILPRSMMEYEVDAVANLWHDTWHRSHDQIVPRALCEFRDKRYFHSRIEREFTAVRVLGMPGEPIGLCIAKDTNLDMLFIAATEQGKGFGERLLDDAETRMRGSGVKEAYLHVALGNVRAIRFYHRCGWSDGGTTEKLLEIEGGTMTNLVGHMIKRL